MLSIREQGKKYRLTVTDKDEDGSVKIVYTQDIDWIEMAKLFCAVSSIVCKQIRKGE